jgi:hypothetical protein
MKMNFTVGIPLFIRAIKLRRKGWTGHDRGKECIQNLIRKPREPKWENVIKNNHNV